MNSADWIVAKLADLGYTDCFAVTGGAAGQLFDALARQKRIKVHFMLHEQACAMACDSYFRYFKRPALLMVTNGPGVSNTLTGILGAFQDSVPMLCVSGQVPTKFMNDNPLLRQLGVQEASTRELVGGIVKSFRQILPGDSLHTLCHSHSISMEGRMGPVWIEVPLDVQAQQHENVQESCQDCRSDLSMSDWNDDEALLRSIKKMWKALSEAKRPLVVLGNGVRLAGVEDEAKEFIHRLGLPVVASWTAADLFSHEDDHYVGNFGILGERVANFAIQEADLLMILGCRMSIPAIGYDSATFSPNSFKVMVDIDIHEVSKPTLDIDLPFTIGLEHFFSMASEPQALVSQESHWRSHLGALKEELSIDNEILADSQEGVDAYRVIRSLSSVLNRFDAVVTDMGTSFTATMQALRRNGTTRVMTSSATSSMGFGLPGALGISLADPHLNVLCIAGDGGFQMNLQETQTWATKAPNLKLLILDSDGYLAISLMQDNLFSGRRIGSDRASGVGGPYFKALLESFGLESFEARNVLEFEETFPRFISAVGRAALVVKLPSAQVMRPRVQTRIGPDGQAMSPSLDQMWPYREIEG